MSYTDSCVLLFDYSFDWGIFILFSRFCFYIMFLLSFSVVKENMGENGGREDLNDSEERKNSIKICVNFKIMSGNQNIIGNKIISQIQISVEIFTNRIN